MGITSPQSQHLPIARRAGMASLLAVLLGSASFPAFAVVVPSQVDPSHVEKQLPTSQTTLPPTSRLKTPPSEPSRMTKQQEAELSKKRFVLKNVVVEGATVFSQDQLKSAYQSLLGKEISLLDAQAIVRRITDMYRSHDYILSQAVIPPQGINGGVLKVRVIEGFISNVVIQGDVEHNNRKLIESYGNNLSAIRPVRTADLERYLLLIDDLPGASAKGLVRPSPKTFGAAELVVTVTHKMLEGSYTLDNRGTKFVGPWQHTGILVANSIFGLNDRTLLRVGTTSPTTELRLFNIQHEEQIGSEGTRLVLDASHSQTEPGDSLKPLEIVGISDSLEAKLLHPFIRSRKENLVGRALFDYRDTDTDVFRNTEFSDDRLRVLRAGAAYDFADNLLGVNLVDGQISQGLDIFNASRRIDQVSNTKADSTFTKLNLDLSRTQPLPHDFSVFTAASGQYAFQPLLAGEQFTLGGVGFGQAYDPAELAGDHGLAGKVELRYGQALNDYYLQSYQLYGYYDIGRVWIREGGVGANDKKSLASTGAGIRTNFSEHLSSYLEVGLPLTKTPNNSGGHPDEPRFFFSVTGRF